MKHRAFVLLIFFCSFPLKAATDDNKALQQEVERLQQQTVKLQNQMNHLQKRLVTQSAQKKARHSTSAKSAPKSKKKPASQPIHSSGPKYHSSIVSVHSLNRDPESLEFYPTALVSEGHVVTYIAGTPVVSSPYLGARPAFDGSDFIVNISSINRDIRLMQQRRSLYRAYTEIGYPKPQTPIIALSGKVEPVVMVGSPFAGTTTADFTLGTSEFDTAAIINDSVEGYISLAFDEAPLPVNGQRLANARVGFNMGFVNIGDLDRTPFYFTAGQLYAPFGRFSSAMVSAPLTLILGRTKTRPFILGYKSQTDTGPFAALYAFRSDTTLGSSAIGGVNAGYVFNTGVLNGEFGASVISSIDDAGGMQYNGTPIGPTFGGFSSLTNGNEEVRKIPAVDAHATLRVSRYNFTAEWLGVTQRFRVQDLSYDGQGALPQALQLELGATFIAFDRPSSIGLGYQWSKDALALNLPEYRACAVFNISIWRDTVESLEYRHDINYKSNQYANGAAPVGLVNAITYGTGKASDTLLLQIGVYF